MNTLNIFWAMFNNQLIIYPKPDTGANVEITGYLAPPSYTDGDLFKKMVQVPDTDDANQIQGLSDEQLKLVRYRVAARLYEDALMFDKAQYMDNKATVIEHKMHATHNDSQRFTSVMGQMKGSGNG